MLSGGSPPCVCVCSVCARCVSVSALHQCVCVHVWQDVKWRLSTRCVCAGVARCVSGGSPPGVCVKVWQDVEWRLSTRCVCAGVARC